MAAKVKTKKAEPAPGSVKVRRVAGGTAVVPAGGEPAKALRRARVEMRMLRDTPMQALNSKIGYAIENREEVRLLWDRIAYLASDFIQNSGTLKGAVDQVIVDTNGEELKLNWKPDVEALKSLGYTDAQIEALKRTVQNGFKFWAWNPAECDLRGKFTIPQLADIVVRDQFAFGEAVGRVDYLTMRKRAAYGITTGVKIALVSPLRLSRATVEFEGLYQGVFHDSNGRPTHYRFWENVDGLMQEEDIRVRDAEGRVNVFHLFEPLAANDVRGISVIASALRTWGQWEKLQDATLMTAILQTIFAAVLKSELPTDGAFKAIEAAQSVVGDEFGEDYADYLMMAYERAGDSRISVDGSSVVSHLAPGEDLEFKTPQAPGSNYIPFSKVLLGEMARAIGVSIGALTMDHTGATYSSVRMENASLWPLTLRRRQRISGAFYQIAFEAWLDEAIGEGRIPFKGGYAAFKRLGDAALWTEWRGPPKPTADDLKTAKAVTERLQNGTSTLEIECAETGQDAQEIIATRAAEQAMCEAAGLPSPFVKQTGGAGADELEGAGAGKGGGNA
jgi:lambda family phage portal protein